MTGNSEAAEAFVCEEGDHHWVSSHEPHAPIWIIECSQCGRHNFTEMLAAHDAALTEKVRQDALEEAAKVSENPMISGAGGVFIANRIRTLTTTPQERSKP